MAETIGSRLRAAREAKGMSIEDVAFETRIHANFVRCLEADDYSNFASTTYAKSFLSLYSRFLGVDAAEALHYFAGSDDIRLGGRPYLATIETVESVRAPKTPRRPDAKESGATVTVRRESPGLAPVILGGLVFLLLAAIPALWFLGKDAESIDDVTTKAKEIAEASRMELAPGGGEGGDAPSASPPSSPSAGSSAAVNPVAGTERKSARERSVAADWVLEQENSTATKESIGNESVVSASESSTAGADVPAPEVTAPEDSGAVSPPTPVAVAVPSQEGGDEPSTALVAEPTESGAQAASRAEREPEVDSTPVAEAADPESGSASDTPPVAMPLTADEDRPDAPDNEEEPPVGGSAPLRAVPLIATPVEVSATGEVGDEASRASDSPDGNEEEESASSSQEEVDPAPAARTNAESRPKPRATPADRSGDTGEEEERAERETTEESRSFVDPRHRFPRPLRR